jgi:hypothetical protein
MRVACVHRCVHGVLVKADNGDGLAGLTPVPLTSSAVEDQCPQVSRFRGHAAAVRVICSSLAHVPSGPRVAAWHEAGTASSRTIQV